MKTVASVGKAPHEGQRAKGQPAAPAGTKPARTGRGAVLGALGKGGCLLGLLAILAILAVFVAFYRPASPTAAGSRAYDDSSADEPQERPPVRAVAFAGNGQLLAYGGDELVDSHGVIRIVRIADHKFIDRDQPLRTIAAHSAPVTGLRFRPGDRELLSTSLDGTVGWWQVETGERFAILETPGVPDETKGLLKLAISSDGRFLAAGGWSGDIYLWDLSDPGAAATVVGRDSHPQLADPKDDRPSGLLEEVRSLVFVAGTPPLLVAGGGDGLLVVFDVASRKVGRVVTLDGKQPSIRDVTMRQWETQRDHDFSINALLDAPARDGVLAADYRGCIYEIATEGPCRSWWLGGEVPDGPKNCIKPLLDKKQFCIPPENPSNPGGAAFAGLVEYPRLPQGYISIAWNDRFRVFRPTDREPWRVFEGGMRQGDKMCTYAAAPEQGLVATGGLAGRVQLYEVSGDAASPDIHLCDSL